MSETANLTKNQRLVLAALSADGGPLSAYTLLDRLRGKGFRAPLQVYRALDRLIELGLAHRLESLNAFVACAHPACEETGVIAFAICEECGTVIEFADEDMAKRLASWAGAQSFRLDRSVLELRGACAACAA